MVLAKEGFAVKNYGFEPEIITISGGTVFAYGEYMEYVIFTSYMSDLAFTGNSIVAGWQPTIPSPYTYTAGTSNDIHTFTESTTAVWAKQSGENGILVSHSGNTGFIPIEGVTIAGETGIENLQVTSNEIQVYPNPVSDVLNFSKETAYKITDLQGRILQESSNVVKSANISNLPSGIYFVTFSTETGKTVRKIVKE